jgi:hypothetical protein
MLRANAASSSKLKVFRHVVLPLTNHDLKKSSRHNPNAPLKKIEMLLIL